MAGDPDLSTSLEILKGLPAAGADVIEVGMPFTDPMADGPAIQAAGPAAKADRWPNVSGWGSLAGLVGTAITLGVLFLVARLLRRREAAAASR